jgi:hypothetical protein
MNLKTQHKILGINLLLFGLLYGLVTLNKTVFRPHLDPGSFLNIVADCFPNFIAAFLVSLAFIVGVLFKNPTKSRLIVYISSAFVFLMLTVEEFNPIWGASTHFDAYDILASGLGSVLAILFFEIIYKRKQAT